ncbi:MAG: NAD(P)-binding domain-containing protein, partial [Desulfobacterales bacterium]|nr:NAD(P)-binding domain-containing protein [Desulfobacterales bacterium]
MSKINKKIGFIGAGNMGEAFVGALIQTGVFSPSMIYTSDISEKRLNILNKTYGISVMKDNFKVFSECEIIVIAVKP